MYSNEIDALLRLRNYLLEVKEYLEAFDPNISTQIERLQYKPFDDSFYCRTNDGYEWEFKVKKLERKGE